jgi:hypothetical protein
MWKARVTENRTFLDVVFDDDDDATFCERCLRSYHSEPDLNKVYSDMFSTSSSLVMFDQISGYVDNVRQNKVNSEANDIKVEGSEVASTMEPPDEALSESDSPHSPLKASEDTMQGDTFCFNGIDDACNETHFRANDVFESGTSVLEKTKRMNSRPCKGQRERYKKMMTRLMSEIDQNPEFILEDARLPPSVLSDSVRKQKLEEKLQTYQERVRRESEIDFLIKPLMRRQYQLDHSAAFEDWLAYRPAPLPR